jgi:hypothetical protein
LIYLIVICLCGLVYIAWRAERIEGLLRAIVAKAEAEEEAARERRPESKTSPLPDEWTDTSWGFERSRQEERAALENPNPLQIQDDFNEARILLEIRERQDPADRVAFLNTLRGRGAYLNQSITEVVLRDESALVRAWGARHLSTTFKDYPDINHAVVLADFEEQILADADPVVRASLWANPNCDRLPWGIISVSENWKEHFRGLSQIERLALMANGGLSMRYVLALLNTETEELGVTRQEHARCLYAACTNPRLIFSSRIHGRETWAVEGDANPPFEELVQTWEINTEKWMDVGYVPFAFQKFIQTTPKVKLAVYQKLLAAPKEKKYRYFREALIESCDPWTDKTVLKAAWGDPDEKCKEAAVKRVGGYRKVVGVK